MIDRLDLLLEPYGGLGAFGREDQLTLQARGERLGAATWRSLAKQTDDAGAREVFLGCAKLEEASAEVLESILGLSGPAR